MVKPVAVFGNGGAASRRPPYILTRNLNLNQVVIFDYGYDYGYDYDFLIQCN
jgi:hypothetical protein